MYTLEQIKERYQQFVTLKDNDKKLIEYINAYTCVTYFSSKLKHKQALKLAKQDWLTLCVDNGVQTNELTRYVLYYDYHVGRAWEEYYIEGSALQMNIAQAKETYQKKMEHLSLKLDIVRYLKDEAVKKIV